MEEQALQQTQTPASSGPDYSLEVDLNRDVIRAGVYGSMPRFYNVLYPVMLLCVAGMAARDIMEYGFSLGFESIYFAVMLVILYVWFFIPKKLVRRRTEAIHRACGGDVLHQTWLFWPQGIQITDVRIGHEVHFRYDTITHISRYQGSYVLRIRPRQMAVLPAEAIDGTAGMKEYLQAKCSGAKIKF